jgi:hypothetical protein
MRSLVQCFKGDLRWWNDLTCGNLRSNFLLSHLISYSGGITEPPATSDSAPAPDAALDAEDAATPRTPATPSGPSLRLSQRRVQLLTMHGSSSVSRCRRRREAGPPVLRVV